MARLRTRGSQRTFAAKSGRKVTWNTGPRGRIGNVSTATNNLFPTAAEATTEDLTIVRVRGDFNAELEQVTAADDGFDEVAFGMCVVSQNAAGIGITAIPDPLTDRAWDGWFVYQTFSLFSSDIQVAGALSTSRAAHIRIAIDSKAMRKIHNTDTIVGVVAIGAINGAATGNFVLNTRILVMLP